jgi:hypothetical protein
VLAVDRKVYTHGYSEIQVPPGDDGPSLLRTGIELLAEGQDLEPALELLTTLLRAGGTAFREDPANVFAVEALRCLALGEDPDVIANAAMVILGQETRRVSRHAAVPPIGDLAAGNGPLVVRGDIMRAHGPVETDRDIVVIGNVGDGAVLKTAGSVRVSGQVGAARLEAGGDFAVVGCVHGKGSGTIVCGGDVTARSIERANVTATGEVRVSSGIAFATVRCGGGVVCAGEGAGAIVGGTIEAGASVHTGRIGAPSCEMTALSVAAPDAIISIRGRLDGTVYVKIGAAWINLHSPLEHVTLSAEQGMISVGKYEGKDARGR